MMLKILNDNGFSNDSQITINGEQIHGLTKLQVTLEVGEPVKVEYETIAQPVDMNIDFSACTGAVKEFNNALKRLGQAARGVNKQPEITTEQLRERIRKNREVLVDSLAYLKKC